MNAEEKLDFSKLKDDVVEMKDSLQLVKRAIMGDLNNDKKGILENIRKLQEDIVETKKATEELKERTHNFQENNRVLQEAIKKIDKLGKDFEALNKLKWIGWGVIVTVCYVFSYLGDFLDYIKSLFLK